MKKFCFITALLVFMGLFPNMAQSQDIRDSNATTAMHKRNPFAHSPEIRNYLWSKTKDRHNVDSEPIKVTGIMEVKGKKMAVIEVREIGSMVVGPGMSITSEKDDKYSAFEVKSVTQRGVLMKLKDGEQIWCKYE